MSKALNTVQRGSNDADSGDRSSDYYGIVRATKPTAVLVETCFITNDAEVAKVSTASGQKIAGEAIADGIADAAGLEAAENSEAWKKDDKGWWYQNPNGTYPRSDWMKVDRRWHWFDKEGYAVTGFQTIGGKDYYFAEKSWKNVKKCQMVKTDGDGSILVKS